MGRRAVTEIVIGCHWVFLYSMAHAVATTQNVGGAYKLDKQTDVNFIRDRMHAHLLVDEALY